MCLHSQISTCKKILIIKKKLKILNCYALKKAIATQKATLYCDIGIFLMRK